MHFTYMTGSLLEFSHRMRIQHVFCKTEVQVLHVRVNLQSRSTVDCENMYVGYCYTTIWQFRSPTFDLFFFLSFFLRNVVQLLVFIYSDTQYN